MKKATSWLATDGLRELILRCRIGTLRTQLIAPSRSCGLPGALILQVIAQPVLFFGLHFGLGLGSLLTFTFAMLASGLIWHMTWKRGMAQASTAWRIATALMLVFFLSVTALGLGLLG